jgi:hypothetical protein
MKDKLVLEDPDRQVEFQFATWEAFESMSVEFEFYGYTIPTADAIDAVKEIVASRTYH